MRLSQTWTPGRAAGPSPVAGAGRRPGRVRRAAGPLARLRPARATGEAGVVPDVEPGPRVEGMLRVLAGGGGPGVLDQLPARQPARVTSLPVVVALHGAGRTAGQWCDELGLDRFLAASGQRMAVAAVDGGPTSFWHERADGQDAGRMVLDEFLPLLRRPGSRHRTAGAARLVDGRPRRDDARRPPASAASAAPVLAVSPALWPDFDQAMPTAFDSEEQYDECMALVRREPRTLDPGRLRDRRPVLPRRPRRSLDDARRRAALRAGRPRRGVLDPGAAGPARLAGGDRISAG